MRTWEYLGEVQSFDRIAGGSLGGGGLQEDACLKEPSLADLRAMRQVSHVAEHAAIGHRLLRGIVGVIDGMGTDQNKDACQHGSG